MGYLEEPAVRGAGRRIRRGHGGHRFRDRSFSIPYLLDRRNSNIFEAIATSVAATRLNFRPMLLWACLIVFLTVLGMVPGLFGLIVTLPLIAHATWHAYRDIVHFDGETAGPATLAG